MFLRFCNLIALAISIVTNTVNAQDNVSTEDNSSIYQGLKFRHIGPAFMSGRISDITIPKNENVWYVTAGSGGVWKTTNSGTTWTSLFDGQNSYSIGCVSLDPNNPETLWVGTGENVGGRHISYGDGIYKSEDGGQSWVNKGLKNSEHISKILVHPNNSNIIWVASQGPLWSKGGERGIYKSVDGGENWVKTLGDEEWVGATDLLMDPRNPEILYAATWQRHRTVAGYIGGGPGTAIYKSTDGGNNWNKLSNGLPTSNMGKIGMAISPQNPDVLYAAIELDRRSGAVYRSDNKGVSWTKMSNAVSGGTGPHYYQELFASPHNFDEIYLADNYMQISTDGGKTFQRMNEKEKHVDNHAVAFKNSDPNYILVGCDGGLYESFDKTKNWKFISNLPITQFYKIAVDDSYPFYNIYGGTQDNNTQGVPSRTDNVHGISNSDWYVVLGGDGHQTATEPGNPDVVYAQWQEGNLNRHDKKTGENIYIKPQADLGEKTERFNWDAPILVSPHKPTRIYHASQRVWKSEDRGDSWIAISGDLTTNTERIQTPFFGKKQKWDNAWDVYAMSNYSTITSLSESPIKEELIYAGTDDGIIQVTEDNGNHWRKVDFSKIKGLPETAFVNDIKADLFNENVVYAVFDNHKYGDYQPYVFMSSDKGKTWNNISKGIDDRTLTWRIVQDHKNENLLFLGTEFGVYFSLNSGQNWTKLKGGLPTISVRDLCIQKRENDLVIGTFGRGIYILDDYSSLRNFDLNSKSEAQLFTPKNGLWYIQRKKLSYSKRGSQGDNFYLGDNPPFGVEFTYFLNEVYQSAESTRKAQEAKDEKAGINVETPEWSILEDEKNEINPNTFLFIYDSSDKIIRKIKAVNTKGFNRISWDLKTESDITINAKNLESNSKGFMVKPGQFKAQLYKRIKGNYIQISDKVTFEVKPLNQNSLSSASFENIISHWEAVSNLRTKANDLNNDIRNQSTIIDLLLKSYEKAHSENKDLLSKLLETRQNIIDLNKQLNGGKARAEVGEKTKFPTVWTYIWAASNEDNSYGPTKSQEKYLRHAKSIYNNLSVASKEISSKLESYKLDLQKIGAPKIKH